MKMSVRFCTCNNKLIVDTSGNVLVFKCEICNLQYPGRPEDTLRWSMKHENESNHATLNRRAVVDDPTLKRVERVCGACNSRIMGMLCVGDNLNVTFVCITCGKFESAV